jgi:hypothetical protein
MRPLPCPTPSPARGVAPAAIPIPGKPGNTSRQTQTGVSRPIYADVAFLFSARDSFLVACRHNAVQRARIWLTGLAVSGGLDGTA